MINKTLSLKEELAQERKKECDTCPLNAGGICSGCGCLLDLKIYSNENSCPEGKWKK